MEYKRIKKSHTSVIHRIVMENHLGRKLKKTEIVHHNDGNKQNNNIKNLTLLKSRKKHNKLHTSKYCPKGHKFTKNNTLFHDNKNGKPSRRCRECHRKEQEKRNHNKLILSKIKQ